MTPKLHKDETIKGSKPISPKTNMFETLSEENQTKPPPAKILSESTESITITKSTVDTQLATMQSDIALMAEVLKSLILSVTKMDELDKIDEIESRQKSSETMMHNMMSNLQSEIDTIKTTTTEPEVLHTPCYADILKTTQKTHKNTTDNATITTPLEVLKLTYPTTSNLTKTVSVMTM